MASRPPTKARPHYVASRQPARPRILTKSFGSEVVESWMDMSKIVAGSQDKKSPYESLASSIGRDVYVDVAGWHLYLRDMNAAPGVKMSTALANQFGPQAKNGLKEADIEAVMKKIPVKLGAGKKQVSLFEITPSMCVGDLARIIEDYGDRS
eukprot:CAMPEP_0202351942 /NCGR_PEP_ID=MMETSP1126-20121109/8352_1 /ASSEMBLY_ACC=CAM_ASM_000457 /TAXON_ID=3047 /ORGANISM="Dunaliella tertiolecta, Strain CCMP1320" /LENGTH=151 /DNA_ID=CAMNT_0048944093 /DNA_START=98 /DNA_END=553 /DNA_ORIENTATION=+